MADNLAVLHQHKPELRAGARIAPIIPTTIEEAFRLAQAIVAAGLAPDSYGMDAQSNVPDPQKILIGILKSIEVGLPRLPGSATSPSFESGLASGATGRWRSFKLRASSSALSSSTKAIPHLPHSPTISLPCSGSGGADRANPIRVPSRCATRSARGSG